MDGRDSHLATCDALFDAIVEAGFEPVEWVDESGWVRAWFDSTFADGLPDGPTLPLLLDDGFARVLNFAGAIADGTLAVWRGAFVQSL